MCYQNYKLQSCAQLLSHVQLCNPMDHSPPVSSVYGDSPGKNTRVGCHALLQGIFPTQGWNPGLLHCKGVLRKATRDAQEYWSGLPCPPPGDLPNPGMEPRAPASQGSSLPSEPPGKPKNTGVGRLSLLQGIFLIQELNWGLLHFRRIPYQLSYVGSPQCDGVE